MSDLDITAQDIRDLTIGIAGGLIVAALIAVVAIGRQVGARGLLHLKRSLARFELQLVEALPTEPVAIAAIATQTNAIIACTSLLIFVGTAAVSYFLSRTALAAESAVGFFLGASCGAAVSLFMVVFRLSVLLVKAVIDRKQLLADLRQRVEDA